ncbi:hypothetical protein RHMOL_Rhmol10G0275900 [Rhododendron molle]|uniref:Uncharacterized protein n=1 Tax=Rhododendron molle TaxID=49168 RepID=A0ACC0M7E1_RHOML|nr:hypothetical protein RHMOL_Rhmol10G0275900 [Rhododendron molle]
MNDGSHCKSSLRLKFPLLKFDWAQPARTRVGPEFIFSPTWFTSGSKSSLNVSSSTARIRFLDVAVRGGISHAQVPAEAIRREIEAWRHHEREPPPRGVKITSLF